MIVRIATESQYRLSDEVLERVNELDNACVAAVEGGDEQAWRSTFEQLLEIVRREGEPLPADDLHGSDVILPPPDLSFSEAGREFSGEGLIPD